MATTTRGEHVYECDTCNRRNRVPENKQGLDVLPNCNITLGCLGKLRRVTLIRDINNTPANPPEIAGIEDWIQRRVLFTYNQTIADSQWLIKHDLANKPVIHAYVYKVIDGESVLVTEEPLSIETIDLNTTLLTFRTAYSGTAQCISLASQNTTNADSINPAAVPADVLQLSSDNGEVTIATLDSSTTVGITITYLSPQGDVIVDYINIDNVVSVDSPWVNAQKAIINGKMYTLRSFNLLTSPLAPPYFSQGIIPNGAGFYLSAISTQPLTPGRVLYVLGTSPFASVDRIYDRYVDAYYVDKTSPQTYITGGKGFVSPSAVKTTYPQILVVG